MDKEERSPLDYLPEIIREIQAVSNPDEIILYGSYARGDYAPDSDLDLLVVKDQVESPNEEAAKIYRALAYLTVSVDVVVVSKAFFQRYRNIIGTVVRPAVTEGRVIYARQ